MNCFKMRYVISYYCLLSLFIFSSQATAGAYQLWEQDGASIANYHAGYAALANDASIAFFNPAGIIRIKNQQLVLGGVGILTDFKYKGTINVNTIAGGLTPFPVTTQGGNINLVPYLHYVAPLSERLGFGFSIGVPFGLNTNYGTHSMLRYAATKTSILVVDFSPSIGIQVTDKASLGIGIDYQRMSTEFHSVAGLGMDGSSDTFSDNTLNSSGYGYHLGGLYQFNSDTRAGLSYHSQVVHHLRGISTFNGPLAVAFNEGPYFSRPTTNITLPAYTALSAYHRFHPQAAIMGSVIYTQWGLFNTLTINNISGVQDFEKSTAIQVTIPEHYHNTWNVSIGGDYYLTERAILRAGIGYDQSPVNTTYRNVQLPDNNRYVFALGGHYQTTKTIGLDLGWTHLFISEARVNPPPQQTGDQITTTNGNVSGGADVYGMQLTWDLN